MTGFSRQISSERSTEYLLVQAKNHILTKNGTLAAKSRAANSRKSLVFRRLGVAYPLLFS
jgi:hypothetical protein